MTDYSGLYLSGYGKELYHFGILGMKWGVRRFQNEDGTLTSAGKKRYGASDEFSVSTERKEYDTWRNILREGQTSEYVNYVADTAVNLLTLNGAGLIRDGARFLQARKSQFDNARYDAERFFNKNKDPVTGLKTKNKEMTPEEDLARVNPEYGNWNSNTKNNCVLCTTAYIMRRKGYDVEAKKTDLGFFPEDILSMFPNASVTKYTNQYEQRYDNRANAIRGENFDYAQDIISQAEANFPDGAYGNILVDWGVGGAHSMVFEIANGKLIIRDGQTNTTYDNPMDILKHTYNIQFIRLDNVDFDPQRIKEWVQ